MYKCLLKKLNSMAVEYAIPCGFQVHLTHDSWWARLAFLDALASLKTMLDIQ